MKMHFVKFLTERLSWFSLIIKKIVIFFFFFTQYYQGTKIAVLMKSLVSQAAKT